jgi:hypothetical protein
LLSFTFIYFSESGLFKGLQWKKIKKIPPALLRPLQCTKRMSRRPDWLRPGFANGKAYSMDSGFRKIGREHFCRAGWGASPLAGAVADTAAAP